VSAQFIFAAICVCASPAFADNLAGQASIIDGDTLEIHGTRIRLWGIDAPESNQLCRGADSNQYRCGAKAANELDAFIARRPVDCSRVSLDQYRRTVAVCSIDGVDLAEWLVRNGLALDWPKYSKGKYAEAQRDASMRGAAYYGTAPTLSRGCFAHAYEAAEGRVTVRTMRTRTLKLTCLLGNPSKSDSFFLIV